MKLVLSVLISLLLFGCATPTPQVLISEKIKVIKPSPEMYNCPTIKTFPNADNLTDVQVAKLIVTLYRNNQKCKNSIDAIQTFLDQAEAEAAK